ncbi:WecB/TagA/CpsF family glycosyltransferase [Microbacterium sp. NPDC090007]|uniref:WecB/TagA/CpsF family glycosyltransferase n=1 Tax=Microbacterium sp. NPDC090007 TaxID=3364204 RepID=UPI003800955B
MERARQPDRRRNLDVSERPSGVGGVTDIEYATEHLVSQVLTRRARGLRTTCAWLNHYTALRVSGARLPHSFADIVAIDGQLLSRIVGEPPSRRTSADSTLPILLDSLPAARIALVGGSPSSIANFRQAFERRWSKHEVVYCADGYGNRPTPQAFASQILSASVDVAIIGLGAPMQERYLAAIKDACAPDSAIMAFTCGGWMDQFIQPDYYPRWAYPLGLTWLVRLSREPRRLWRRYTVDAIHALIVRRKIRRNIHDWRQQS